MSRRRRATIAEAVAPAIEALIGPDLPVGVRFWDGSALGAADAPAAIEVRSPLALRYLLWSPGELGLARAYVSGSIDARGDLYEILALRDRVAAAQRPRRPLRAAAAALHAASRLSALGPPPPVPREEARLSGRRHSKRRDAAAIAHHYDISNDFYRIVLGETMTYSCAYFAHEDLGLDDAQHAKHDLICRKLGLRPGMRLLDVGCGWGSMAMHAARHYGVEAVGITISREQAEEARRRVAQAGLQGRVEIRLQDYREVSDGPYEAISSIGMFEHVGLKRLREYFDALAALLPAGGRLLNHGISRPSATRRARFARRSFIDRYVFPDGELHEVGSVVSVMQRCGLEVRDVESLREHYARTLRSWVANLEASWDAASTLVGEGRARVWRLYMAASALNFAANRTSVHQVLAVRPDATGRSGMPRTRVELLGWDRADEVAPTT
ncbi:MAG TPA: cyclopropane-fatty-acyl-phospholipid synthase family protein [Acidimicrobiales bacterium]|nr:cyclopropane-fatty-acyl-phospholipid synthase family protein [Acidimicrobiales bacterium]